MSNRERLLSEAKKWLGKDASPYNYASQELGCAESVCSILKHSVARDFPLELATWLLNTLLRKDKRFKSTLALSPGNIILSPSFSGNGKIRGHVGIIGENGTIMSADSGTGIWKENYNIQTWVTRYRKLGGFPIYVFEPLGTFSKEEQMKDLQKQLSEIETLVARIKAFISRLTTRSV